LRVTRHGQGQVQDVCGIHRTFAATSANQSMYLIDKENDLAIGLGNFFNNGF